MRRNIQLVYWVPPRLHSCATIWRVQICFDEKHNFLSTNTYSSSGETSNSYIVANNKAQLDITSVQPKWEESQNQNRLFTNVSFWSLKLKLPQNPYNPRNEIQNKRGCRYFDAVRIMNGNHSNQSLKLVKVKSMTDVKPLEAITRGFPSLSLPLCCCSWTKSHF